MDDKSFSDYCVTTEVTFKSESWRRKAQVSASIYSI